MSLIFEVAKPPTEPDLQRADVACFIGHVARRVSQPVPDAVTAQLTQAGWIGGLWAKPPGDIDALLNVPVVVDGWDLFDRLYAWDERPLAAGPTTLSDNRCATWLGAAVRSFFARGGRRAVIVRVGDPWPYLEDGASRETNRRERVRRLLPDFTELNAPSQPFAPHDPASWQGIHHLYGLRDTSLVLLPDLPDACLLEPPIPNAAVLPPPVAEGFVECSADEPVLVDTSLRNVPAPRLDSNGYAAWQLAITTARAFLALPRMREVLLVAALPLPHVDARRVSGSGGSVFGQADMLAWLQRIGVIGADGGSVSPGVASAFVQLGWPWLRTQAASDLPEGLEAPDGVLAGLIATGASLRGTFRSVAGDSSLPRLRDVAGAEPVTAWGLGDDSPAAQLARHVCVFAPTPDGWALQSDVTTAADEAWRFGGASRLMGALLRSARAQGDRSAFDPNGPLLWARVRRQIEDLLLGFWREGAFAGATVGEAFNVRCDRSTMTQNDVDNGRLIVEVSVRPAMSIERITVVLNLGNAGPSASVREAA